MAHIRSNIVLIGMPGSGKSTVGVILAKLTSLNFIDTDVLIQVSHGQTLQDIVDTSGHMALRRIEEKELLNLHVYNHVIATGGSAVYSPGAMKHLKSDGIAVFLDVDLPTLESRVCDFDYLYAKTKWLPIAGLKPPFRCWDRFEPWLNQ